MRRRRAFSCFALAALLLILAACGAREKREAPTRTSAFPSTVEAAALCSSTLPREQLKRVAAAGMTTLYFDETTCAVSVYDAGAKTLWRTLPEQNGESLPAVLQLHVLENGTEYLLHSQTDSVAEGRAHTVLLEDGVQVTYGFEKLLPSGKLLQFSIPVSFCMEEGLLRVEIDPASLRGADCARDAVPLSLEVLPWFGSAKSAEAGDFLFLPDGCGAAFDLASPALRSEPVELQVYEPNGAPVAAFGMKQADAAFTALVESGDSFASIRADFKKQPGTLARVGAVFALTPYETAPNDRVWTAGRSAEEKIRISYRFLSGSAASEAGMAAACRTLLIRSGTLDFAAAASESAPDLHLHLLGAASFAEPGKGSLALSHTLTSFSRAQDLLSFLRGKGISNPALFYYGMFSGGLVPRGGLKLSLRMREAVSMQDFAAFAESSGVEIYPMAALRVRAGTIKSAETLGGEPIRFECGFSGSRIAATGSGKAIGASRAEHADAALLQAARRLPFRGIGLLDAGRLLFADAGGARYADRAAGKAQITAALEAVSASKKLAVCGGNIFALKYAATVLDLPNTAQNEGEDCRAVPFLQMLLHGAVSYSGKPLNLCESVETALLKAAEYGEVPAFALYAADYGSSETPDSLNHLQNAALLQSCRERMQKTFADLAAQRITLHEEVQPGVFCTGFGTNTRVYVNYNETDAVQNGVTIPAKSFLRMN